MPRIALTVAIAALALAASGSSAGMSEEMVAAHNEVRATVQVPPLTWSADLAAYADEWAEHLRDEEGCKARHRPFEGKFAQQHGENLYWGSAMEWSTGKKQVQDVSVAHVVRSWAKEADHYDYATNRCTAVCGHYTQVVWRASREVGCAMAVCGESKEQIWVCNYSPAGNWEGEKPY